MINIRLPERKIRSFCGGTRDDSKNPLIWVSVVSRVRFAPTTATVSPYHRVFFRLGYTRTGNESNSVRSRQRNWWLWSERAHMRTAKLASSTKRLTGTVAPFGTFVEGTLAKARFVHHSGYSR